MFKGTHHKTGETYQSTDLFKVLRWTHQVSSYSTSLAIETGTLSVEYFDENGNTEIMTKEGQWKKKEATK